MTDKQVKTEIQGQEIVGKVVDQNETTVWVEATVDGMVDTWEIDKAEVKEIEEMKVKTNKFYLVETIDTHEKGTNGKYRYNESNRQIVKIIAEYSTRDEAKSVQVRREQKVILDNGMFVDEILEENEYRDKIKVKNTVAISGTNLKKLI